MRILWISDSPTSPSGFGGVSRELCSRLSRMGHRIEILGWQSKGTTTHWQGIPIHPVKNNLFGADALLAYAFRFRPDYIITLGDVWWMAFMADPQIQRYLDQASARWALYYPIDGADRNGALPEGWRAVLKSVDVPIAMSRFGVAVSRACGIEPHYVPHGCNTGLFSPPHDKAAAKRQSGYEGKFVILSDARNQPRKLLPRLLDIAREFCEGKNDVIVHLHCDPFDDAARSDLYCYDIIRDVKLRGLEPWVRFTPEFRMIASGGIPIERLAALYQASDVHLLCSWGEGFGLPTLQAASAGVVPMAVGYSASRELVEGHGYAIPAESWMLDEFGLVRCLISRKKAVEALEILYGDRRELARRSALARDFALDYDWNRVASQFDAVLRNAAPRLKPDRLQVLHLIGGAESSNRQALSRLPDRVQTVMREAVKDLPEGAQMQVKMAERTLGDVSALIRKDAFADGEELSIPVRLPPAFPGAPRAKIGWVLVMPRDMQLAAQLRRIFPRLQISLPKPENDPSGSAILALEDLIPALVHYSLVIDTGGALIQNLDIACAILGIPYLGASALWADVSGDTALEQARMLLTDQGFSRWRRDLAMIEVEKAVEVSIVAQIRRHVLESQPKGNAEPGHSQSLSQTQMWMVRPKTASADCTDRIVEFANTRGGLVLMATPNGLLILSMPEGGKEVLECCADVSFVGGVTIDPEGKGSKALSQRFARNAARQMAARSALGMQTRPGLRG